MFPDRRQHVLVALVCLAIPALLRPRAHRLRELWGPVVFLLFGQIVALHEQLCLRHGLRQFHQLVLEVVGHRAHAVPCLLGRLNCHDRLAPQVGLELIEDLAPSPLEQGDAGAPADHIVLHVLLHTKHLPAVHLDDSYNLGATVLHCE